MYTERNRRSLPGSRRCPVAVTNDLESSVRQIGEELARLSGGQSPTLFERRWWSQAAINLAMHNLDFKTQLFRFIDVLPSVTEDQRVVTLAQEYFGCIGRSGVRARLGLESPRGHRDGRQAERACDSCPSRTDGAHVHCRLVGLRCDTGLDALVDRGQGLVGRSAGRSDDQRPRSRPLSRSLPGGSRNVGAGCPIVGARSPARAGSLGKRATCATLPEDLRPISSRGSDRSGGQFRHPWRGVSVRSSMRRCGRRPR